MKSIIKVILILPALYFNVYAQTFDEARMDRDLEVAENILGELASRGSRLGYWSKGVNGSYVKGYGVIFTLPHNFVLSGRTEAIITAETIYFDKSSKSDKVEQKSGDTSKTYSLDSLREARVTKLIEIMKFFLVDYADLIGQLEPTDRIMVTERGDRSGFAYIGSGEVIALGNSYTVKPVKVEEKKISAEIIKKDIIDYKKGTITRQQLMDKVAVKKETTSREKEPEFELLASIFGRLYKGDLSNSYYSPSTPSYERLSNFGVIFKMKVYTSGGRTSIWGSNQLLEVEDEEERKKMAQDLYPEFLDELKRNIIEYGRTLRNFQADEILMFIVEIADCRKCKLPKSIDLSVKGSILSDYNKGTITLNEATGKISVKEQAE